MADKQTLKACAIGGAVLIVIILYSLMKREEFQNIGRPADLPDGIYTVSSSGNTLSSNVIDTVMCNDFLLGKSKPEKIYRRDWKLKRVAQSVYIFYKEGERECLYTHPSNSPRSYYFPDCTSKNLCGLETPNYEGELDGDSLRTYFMILQHPSGMYYIKSMKNDMYLQQTKDKLSFSKSPNKNCLFSFRLLKQQ